MLLSVFFDGIKIALPVFVFISIPVIIFIIYYSLEVRDYKKGSYYKITHVSYGEMNRNVGRYGEYLIYKNLRKYESENIRFLFNAYIPKENGATTELDVIMICDKGVYVFESKNFSGWIFGDSNKKSWCQTLPAGRGGSRKEYFYNPVWQNAAHIAHLKALIGEDVPIFSFIVFSERCELKNVACPDTSVWIIKRNELDNCVITHYGKQEKHVGQEKICELYNALYPYTQTDPLQRKEHAAAINDFRKIEDSSGERGV